MTVTPRTKLLAQKAKIASELMELSKQRASLEVRYDALERSLKKLEKELVSDAYEISEHAILRYLERVCGIDMEITKKAILPEKWVKRLPESGTFDLGTHRVVVANQTIITVLTPEYAERKGNP